MLTGQALLPPALLDRSDNQHVRAVGLLRDLSRGSSAILITNFIVAECHALLAKRLGIEIARDWLAGLCWPVERITEEDEEKAKQLIAAMEDKSYTYCDATTFTAMERLEIGQALAFDQHFVQYGFRLYGSYEIHAEFL